MGAELAAFARDDALDYRMIEQSQDAFAFDVTACRYAEFYKELGEPDLGFLLVCSADFDMAEGFGPDIKLARTQTIMQGASHCDFRYTRSGSTADEVDGSRSRHLVPRCGGRQAFTSKMGAIRYEDYRDRPRLRQERFSGPRR